MKYIYSLFLLTIYFNADAAINRHPVLIDRSPRLTADTDTVVRKKSLSVGISYGSDASFLAVPALLNTHS